MKNTNLKLNKIKLIVRLMLVVVLGISAINITGCTTVPTVWEVNEHRDFVQRINKYNSVNNDSVDIFISFDFDANESVTKSIYYFWSEKGYTNLVKKHGLYDIYNKFYEISQIFYLHSSIEDENFNEYEYKIMYDYNRNHTQNNFTAQDKIEIRAYEPENSSSYDDLKYVVTLKYDDYIENYYNYCYYYKIYVNDIEMGSIRISSIYEATDEKLNEICKLLLDSIVIINTEV